MENGVGSGENHPKPLLGTKASKETKEKMSLSHKGKKRQPFSEEWKINMSVAHIGKTSPMTGKNHSIETRKKMSNSRLGKKRGPYKKKVVF